MRPPSSLMALALLAITSCGGGVYGVGGPSDPVEAPSPDDDGGEGSEPDIVEGTAPRRSWLFRDETEDPAYAAYGYVVFPQGLPPGSDAARRAAAACRVFMTKLIDVGPDAAEADQLFVNFWPSPTCGRRPSGVRRRSDGETSEKEGTKP